MFNIIYTPRNSKNYLVTIAIGENYYKDWFKFALPNWLRYCKKNDIGIIAITHDLLSKKDPTYKKPTWQKLLIGKIFIENKLDIENICYLDSDILANPQAPNIFENYDDKNIGVVSQRKNLEQPLNETLRKIAFLRHYNYSNQYPLDSSLFMTTEDVYKYHNVEPQNDYFCAGLFVFNLKNHGMLMNSWFDKYTKDIHTLTGGGDEPILNYEFLNYGKINWLDYKFQALWIYEISWKYPFLYNYGKRNIDLIKECVEASLTTNYFLHFAGSWFESEMWKIENFFENAQKKKYLENYHNYLKLPVTGKPVGLKKP